MIVVKVHPVAEVVHDAFRRIVISLNPMVVVVQVDDQDCRDDDSVCTARAQLRPSERGGPTRREWRARLARAAWLPAQGGKRGRKPRK